MIKVDLTNNAARPVDLTNNATRPVPWPPVLPGSARLQHAPTYNTVVFPAVVLLECRAPICSLFKSFFLQQKLDRGNFTGLTPLPDSVIIRLRKFLVNFRPISNLSVEGQNSLKTQ